MCYHLDLRTLYNYRTNIWKDGLLVLTQTWQQCAAPWRRVLASLFEMKILPMYFVFNVKSLLLYRVNSYSTQLMRMPHELFITKKELVASYYVLKPKMLQKVAQ